MKKVVVVVDENKVFLEGEALKVINKDALLTVNTKQLLKIGVLVVKDKQEELAVFQKWDYWQKIE